jgi:hypothetical protein
LFSRKTSILLPLATAALMLGLAGPASAATNFTSSQITTPADNSFVAYNVDSPNTIHVQGTTAGGDSNADLVCFYGASRRVLATGVTVTAGAFSADLPLNSFTTGAPRPYCVLRAIPTADPTNYPPEAASAFAGPRIGYGRSQTYKVAGSGLNQNAVWDYFIAQAQSQGYTDYLSLGGCGLDYSFVFDPITLAQSQSLFYCNGWTSSMDGCTSAAATCTAGTQSELRVDGNNAYPPGSARGLYSVDATHSSELLSGFPPLTFTKSIDPLNGNVHIDETDPIVSCSPNRTAFHTDSTDPAWSTDCSSFASTGVRLDRTIQSDQNGRRARIVDTWSSTDGASHDLEVLYDEEFRGDSGTNPSPTFAYSWMDGSSFSPATAGQTVQGPGGSGPATVFVDGNGATADAFAQPQGAVTIAPAPTSVRWYSTSNPYSYGVFRFAQTIPAGGSATVSRTYVNGGSKAEIAAQVSAEQDRLGKPSVAITSPANGSTSDTAAATVTGTASDPGGAVTGVTVNGQAATVAADGTWSKALTLAPGENTITAVASDAAGNSSSASVKVTYTPKPPPVLTPPADKVPPTLGLIIAKLKLAKMLAKGLPVTVSCSEACSFTVTLVVDSKTAKKLHLAGIVILGKKSGSLAAKGSKKVTVKLTKKAKRQLAKAKKVTISVKLTAKDTVGNGSTKTKKVTVNR